MLYSCKIWNWSSSPRPIGGANPFSNAPQKPYILHLKYLPPKAWHICGYVVHICGLLAAFSNPWGPSLGSPAFMAQSSSGSGRTWTWTRQAAAGESAAGEELPPSSKCQGPIPTIQTELSRMPRPKNSPRKSMKDAGKIEWMQI